MAAAPRRKIDNPRVEVTDDVGDLGADGSVQVTLEAGVEGGSEGDVGNGDSLANKEGPLLELAVNGSKTGHSLVDEVLVDRLVVWDVTGNHAVGELYAGGNLKDLEQRKRSVRRYGSDDEVQE